MNYRIEEREAFSVIGVKRTFTMDEEANFRDLPLFWKEFNGSALDMALYEIAKRNPNKYGGLYLGVCFPPSDPAKPSEFEYMIAAEAKQPEGGFVRMEVPKATWAVFRCIGAMPKAIQEMWTRIHGEFFPTSCYERADAPDFELYTEGDNSKIDYISEIWVPVTLKK